MNDKTFDALVTVGTTLLLTIFAITPIWIPVIFSDQKQPEPPPTFEASALPIQQNPRRSEIVLFYSGGEFIRGWTNISGLNERHGGVTFLAENGDYVSVFGDVISIRPHR